MAEQPFEFGDWRVDPSRGLLTAADGREARLEPKLMDLLVLFAGSGGRVLGKDEIVRAGWDGRAIGDDTLAAAVSRLRRALGETPARRYIETVPKRGYRSLIGAPDPAATVRPGPPDGPAEVVALVEQGRRALGSPLSLTQARLYFEEAVRKAPGFAPAHRGLAEALLVRHFAGGGEGLLTAAKAAANAAVGLGADAADGWAILGLAILLADRDFAAADAAFQRAIALDPASAPAHRRRAFAFATVGRFVDAERAARRAVELQPASLEARDELLQLLIAARRYRHAAAEAAAVLAMAPESGEAWFRRGWALALAGDEADGLTALLRGLELWGVDAAHLAHLREAATAGGLAAVAGAAADVFAQQQVLYARRTMDLAMLRATAGQADAALEALESAAARDDPVLLLIRWLPYFDPLRGEARFEAFVRRLRLVA